MISAPQLFVRTLLSAGPRAIAHASIEASIAQLQQFVLEIPADRNEVGTTVFIKPLTASCIRLHAKIAPDELFVLFDGAKKNCFRISIRKAHRIMECSPSEAAFHRA